MDKVKQLYQKWLNLQPLKPEDQKRLDDKFRLEFNYNSNHLEGNTLTYGQTKLLLLFDETSGNAALKDYQEMKAHNVGLEMIRQYASDTERPLTEGFIRELNQTILVENYWKEAITPDGQPTRMEVKVGEYKSRPNSVITVTGERFDYASVEETPAFMSDLVVWYNEAVRKGELSPVELAALLHYRYIRIHPFEDGNGRIARLLVNYVLAREGYPMAVIKSKDKATYLRILHQCDVEVGLTPSDGARAPLEKIRPFVDYLEKQLVEALQISIRAAEGKSIEEEDDFEKKVALFKRKLTTEKDQIQKSSYLVKDVINQVFWRLIDIVEAKWSDIRSLFDEYQIQWEITYPGTEEDEKWGFYRSVYGKKKLPGMIPVKYEFKKQNIDYFKLRSVELQFYFKYFRNDGDNTFDVDTGISIEFGLHSYWIKNNGYTKLLEKGYEEEVQEGELMIIANRIGEKLLKAIESKLR